MAMAQNDRNPRITQKAFEVVGDGYGLYTVKEVATTIAAPRPRVRFQSSDQSTIMKPINHPMGRNPYFVGAHPFIGHAGRFERSNEKVISCDEAFQLYGGVLMKKFYY